jgi:lipopolysaccharide/colanic/teichoic acid biosynthesis glycosyltransferase
MSSTTFSRSAIAVILLIVLASLALIVSQALRLVTLDPTLWEPGQRKREALFKRVFDVVVSTAGLVLASPLLLLIAVANFLTSPGPIFYMAPRVGLHGRHFSVYKFRTMIVNADKIGPKVTVAGDSRITPIGRLLRRTKLDELPQLLNVLCGDMSLVGPRPEDPRYVALYTPAQRVVLDVYPGITSPASVHYKDEQSLLTGPDWETRYVMEILPAKLAIDLEYSQHPNVVRDVRIISRTLFALYTNRRQVFSNAGVSG